MDNWKEEICTEMWKIIRSHNSNRTERIEAAKVICAVNGVLLPDVDERYLSATASVKLRRAKAALVESMLFDGKLPKLRAEQDDTAVSEPIAAPIKPAVKTPAPTVPAKQLNYFEQQAIEKERAEAEQAEPDPLEVLGEQEAQARAVPAPISEPIPAPKPRDTGEPFNQDPDPSSSKLSPLC